MDKMHSYVRLSNLGTAAGDGIDTSARIHCHNWLTFD